MKVLLTYKKVGLDKKVTVLATVRNYNVLLDFLSSTDFADLVRLIFEVVFPSQIVSTYYLVGVSDVDFKSPRPTYRFDFTNYQMSFKDE